MGPTLGPTNEICPRFGLALLPLLLVAGCAGPNQIAATAPRIPFEQIAQGQPGPLMQQLARPPYVLAIRAGQGIPVDFALGSSLFELNTGAWELQAKRDFYILVRQDGIPLLSEDGVEFEQRPQNSFQLGLRATKDQPATIQVRLNIRKGPEPSPGATPQE